MASTAVRVPDEALIVIQRLARDEDLTAGGMIAKMAKQYEERKFQQEVKESLARLKQDPEAWKEYQAEIALWDNLPNDALMAEESYYTPEEERQIHEEVARTESR
jgi:hypothetical protein